MGEKKALNNSRKILVFILAVVGLGVFFERKLILRVLVSLFKKKVPLAERFRVVRERLEAIRQNRLVFDHEEILGDAPEEYDFSKVLLLLEEVNMLVKQGVKFDPTKIVERQYLLWLRQELETEKSLFFKFLAVHKQDKPERSAVRPRKALMYYLRAINNSLARIQNLLSKVKVQI